MARYKLVVRNPKLLPVVYDDEQIPSLNFYILGAPNYALRCPQRTDFTANFGSGF